MSYGTYCTLNAFCSKKLNNHINFAKQQRQLEKIIAKQQAQNIIRNVRFLISKRFADVFKFLNRF